MTILFEHQKIPYENTFLDSTEERNDFKKTLQFLWETRKMYGLAAPYFDYSPSESRQQFFSFYDSGFAADKYIGTIKFADETIHVLPKFLKGAQGSLTEDQLLSMAGRNLLWWLSKCTKIKFPKSFTEWSTQSFDFLDTLIFLFASLTRDDLIYNKHQSYVEKEESLSVLRGRIDFTAYAVNYFTGKSHVLPCVYDTLEIDNLYNQIVKYTSRLLYQITDNDEIKKLLMEITWILDDVSDSVVTARDCDRVIVSPLNENMSVILDYCKIFLGGMSLRHDDSEIEVFSLLLPAEDLFEDFVGGFVKERFENRPEILSINFQSDSNGRQVSLATEKNIMDNHKKRNVFRLKPDIFISGIQNSIILDTKYKSVYTRKEALEEDRLKSGVSVQDIYQMLAYMVKLNVNTCHLLYPSLYGRNTKALNYYEIIDFEGLKNSKVYYHRISSLITDIERELTEVFKEANDRLFKELESIIL